MCMQSIKRVFISAAALLVKVMARMEAYLCGWTRHIFRYSLTSVKVLPEPAEDL